MTDPFVRPDVAGFLGFVASIPGPKMHRLDAVAARGLYGETRDVGEAQRVMAQAAA